jgi:hypothetical protein
VGLVNAETKCGGNSHPNDGKERDDQNNVPVAFRHDISGPKLMVTL